MFPKHLLVKLISIALDFSIFHLFVLTFCHIALLQGQICTHLCRLLLYPFIQTFLQQKWKKDGLRDVMWTCKTCSVSLYQPHQFPHLLGWFNDRHFTSQLKQCDRLAAVSQGGAVKCFMMQGEAIIINHVWLIGCGCITAQVWGGEGLKYVYLYCRNIQISRNKHYNSAVVGL